MLEKKYLTNFKLLKENKTHVYIKARHGPAKETRIPKKLTLEVCFLVGVILGDGHLKKDKARIVLELTNRPKLEKIARIFESTFAINKIRITTRIDKRKNRKIRFGFNINNTPIYQLFAKIFGIPLGKKSNIIKVPSIIKNSTLEMKKSFLLGVLITDGGKRHTGYGLSSASEEFRDNVAELLMKFNINCYKDQWVNKTYKKPYYGFYFNKEDIQNMRGCRSGQTGQILSSLYDELEGLA